MITGFKRKFAKYLRAQNITCEIKLKMEKNLPGKNLVNSNMFHEI